MRKHTLATIAAICLALALTAVSPRLTQETEAVSTLVGGIVLVAGDVVDLQWDPSLYPAPPDQRFVRWELKRSAGGGAFAVIDGDTTPSQSWKRDTGLAWDTAYTYKLEVTRCVEPCLSPDDERIYGVFNQSTTTGRLAGKVLLDLTLSAGEIEITGLTTIGSGKKLSIGEGTTLKGNDTGLSDTLRAEGGELRVTGGRFVDNVLLQYGTSSSPHQGAGVLHNAVFEKTSYYKAAVEMYGQEAQFEIVNVTAPDIDVSVWGKATLRAKGNTGLRMTLYDEVRGDIQGSEANLVLHDHAFALVKKNARAAVVMIDESTATIEDNTEGYVSLGGKSSATIRNNTLSSMIIVGDEATATIEKNPLLYGVRVEESASAIISGNTITGTGVEISGYGAALTATKASATVIGNTIVTPWQHRGVSVMRGATAEVVGNTIEWTGFHGTESSVLLDAWADDAQLTAKSNTVVHGKIVASNGVGITLTDNVVMGDGAAITIGCVVCGTDTQATGTIERNTVHNGWGFEMWAGSEGLNIRHNCIRGNDPGLTTDERLAAPLDMRYNWWGHVDGPRHPANPGGKGDAIEGSKVLYDPWDRTDGYCQDTPTSPDPDLSFAGIEAVQVVQDLQNVVPLVEGKPTVLRAYPESNRGTVAGVPWELKAYRDGSLLGTRSGTMSVGPISNIDTVRASQSKGIWVELPAEWLTGTVDVAVELQPVQGVTEVTYRNNTAQLTLQFRKRFPLRVAYVPIEYKPPGETGSFVPDTSRVPEMNRFLETLYPHPKIDYKLFSAMPWTLQMSGAPTQTEMANAQLLLGTLNFRILFWNANHPPLQGFDQIVGLVPGSPAKYYTSYALSDPRWYTETQRPGLGLSSYCWTSKHVMAHEIGHNLGLLHANTPDSRPPGTPYVREETYWDGIYRDATIQEYGYNPRSANPGNKVVSKRTYDLMAYREPDQWLSPLHYSMLYLANGVPQAQSLQAAHRAGQTYLIASGLVDRGGQVSFQPFWQLTMDEEPPNPPEGTAYCLELRNAEGGALSSHCFDLDFYVPEAFSASDVAGFTVALPLETGTASVALRKGAVDLGAVAVSENAPTVTVVTPNGGESVSDSATVQWSANDDDGDPLAFNISYSADDGVTWQLVAANVTGTTSYALDLSLLPGSSSARIRVEASDGFHTTGDESDGAFTVEDHAPIVGIEHPADGSTMIYTNYLIGYAYDPEEGELPDTSLTWSSNIDGSLGTGTMLQGTMLSEGEHTLTLTAEDSEGHQSSASVTVQVIEGFKVYLPFARR
ncbi:MAG: right-handed parallel beta-helix repeat-containing protein [Anaerolineae bacterium]|nr:right-handed parallel beta-helix repeat-containing protein [Anaerolineae bacterium]